MNNGWIKIHRKLLDWEWYDEPNTFRLFFHLLLKANHKPKKYRGVNIETGQVMTGFSLLAEQTGLTVQKVRTSLSNLKSTNEITIKSGNKGTVIQIVKYTDYQVATSKITNEQQTDNKQVTTNKNDNKEKNENNIEIYPSFDDFWDLYNKKVGREISLKKWNKLKQIEKESIMLHIPNYKNSVSEIQYLKNPTTYLNGKCWNDEIITNKTQIKDGKKQFISDFANAIKNGQQGGATLINEINSSNGQIE